MYNQKIRKLLYAVESILGANSGNINHLEADFRGERLLANLAVAYDAVINNNHLDKTHKFKVGDHVKIIRNGHAFKGHSGIILDAYVDAGNFVYRVKINNGVHTLKIWEDALVLNSDFQLEDLICSCGKSFSECSCQGLCTDKCTRK